MSVNVPVHSRIRSLISFVQRREEAILIPGTHAVYVPVAKVANSSMKGLIARIAHERYPDVEFREEWPPYSFRNRDPRRLLKKYGVIIPLTKALKLPGTFKFGFVRNPWDRLVSCYAEKIVKNHGTPEGISRIFRIYGGRFFRGMSFQHFAESVAAIPDILADPHIRSQHVKLSNRRDNILVDRVVRIEDFEKELPVLFKDIGIPDRSLGSMLKSEREDYRSYYTPNLFELVGRRYKKDITIFGYSDVTL